MERTAKVVEGPAMAHRGHRRAAEACKAPRPLLEQLERDRGGRREVEGGEGGGEVAGWRKWPRMEPWLRNRGDCSCSSCFF